MAFLKNIVSGYLGNKAASEVIKYIGARPKISLKLLL